MVILSLIALVFQLGISCDTYRVTGYASQQFPGYTRDGTPTIGNEWTLVAVDPNIIPLQSYVWVEGEDDWPSNVFRAADTGNFWGRHVDILVNYVSQAYKVTGYRRVCVL